MENGEFLDAIDPDISLSAHYQIITLNLHFNLKLLRHGYFKRQV